MYCIHSVKRKFEILYYAHQENTIEQNLSGHLHHFSVILTSGAEYKCDITSYNTIFLYKLTFSKRKILYITSNKDKKLIFNYSVFYSKLYLKYLYLNTFTTLGVASCPSP